MRIVYWSSDVCSSDLISTPHPGGLCAQLAMRGALARAGIDAADVGYLNLHGTATPANDAVEAHAVAMLFPDTLHAGSTKGWTGHTLGAAGIVESVFALIALEDGLLPGTLTSEARDTACGPQQHRSEERQGGEESGRTCRSRWLPYHQKKKK